MAQKQNGGYNRLDIYHLAHDLAVKIHKLTLSLPKHETYEEGSQVRRSSKSIAANIVEGYVLRKYKNEYSHYLYRAHASTEETIEHLKLIVETKSSIEVQLCEELLSEYKRLSSMVFHFIRAVETKHETPLFLREDSINYSVNDFHAP
ncbi:MAG: four helix bundle protein [Ignavibacteriales bacterium]|nr:four helix bundle protein [Ignavibacteriales bacterium]